MQCEIISPLDCKVGETYSVPCIKNRHGHWMPIVGPKHLDGAELCQDNPIPAHYHLDARFVKVYEKLIGYQGYGDIEYQDRVCIAERSDNGIVLWPMIRLGRAFRNFRINPSNPICPHNRQNIVNKDGQCPGHGFCWNLETGRPKYRWPYFVRFKGTSYKYPAEDRAMLRMPYPDNALEEWLWPVIVELIDSDDQVIGEHVFRDQRLRAGDVFTLTTNCTETKRPRSALYEPAVGIGR